MTSKMVLGKSVSVDRKLNIQHNISCIHAQGLIYEIKLTVNKLECHTDYRLQMVIKL